MTADQRQESHFWIVGIVLVLGSPTLMGVRLMLGQHPDLADWIYHAVVFVAGFFILDKERARDFLSGLVPFWKRDVS